MSDQEPTECYVYQPGPWQPGDDPKIFAIAGPGSEPYRGNRYTQDQAIRTMKTINAATKQAQHEDRKRRTMKLMKGLAKP
jgi:hypothetical protein